MLLHQIIATQGTIGSDVSAVRSEVGKAITRLEVIETRNRTADLLHSDHETRIRLLERFRYTLAGMAILAGVLAGLVGSWIGAHVH